MVVVAVIVFDHIVFEVVLVNNHVGIRGQYRWKWMIQVFAVAVDVLNHVVFDVVVLLNEHVRNQRGLRGRWAGSRYYSCGDRLWKGPIWG